MGAPSAPVRILVAAFAALALSPAVAEADDALDRVRKAGELTWAGDVQGGEPYVFEDPKDPARRIGFEVEIADLLASHLAVRATFRQVEWSSLVPALERGDFDVALNGLEDTPARRDRVLLSVPYFVYGETLAVRKGEAARSIEALKGRRVGTLNQTYAYELLRSLPVELVQYEGVEEPYQDLQHGRVDAVLLDHIIADRYGCVKADLECVPGDVARGTYVAAVRKSDASLKAALDAAITSMIRNGELRTVLERWKLWDARQEGLVSPLPAARAPVAPAGAGPASAHSWTLAHTLLFVKGAAITLGLSFGAFALALPLGLALAIARLEPRGPVKAVAGAYVEVVRGTPLLLQLYLLYYGLAGVLLLSPVTAAVLGLGLNYAAYESEIHRGALLALPRGQSEAARALGLDRWQSLRYVLLPQSLRVALPSMTNDFVALLKDSSLVSVITVVELTKRMTIMAVDLRSWILPGIACAGLYFIMSFPLARLAQQLEKRLHRDSYPQLA